MIIATLSHQSNSHGRKEGWFFRICDLNNLVPQLKGDDFNQAPATECYGIPYFTKEPKVSQEQARQALHELFPDYKEVGIDQFDDLIEQKLVELQRAREARARELGWQKNSIGRACIKCGGPINRTEEPGFGGAWGQIYHGWSKCAKCGQEYCTEYMPDYTRLNSNESIPPSWSYKDQEGRYIDIDPPSMLEIATKWEEILSSR